MIKTAKLRLEDIKSRRRCRSNSRSNMLSCRCLDLASIKERLYGWWSEAEIILAHNQLLLGISKKVRILVHFTFNIRQITINGKFTKKILFLNIYWTQLLVNSLTKKLKLIETIWAFEKSKTNYAIKLKLHLLNTLSLF